jgi:hypothetical protein
MRVKRGIRRRREKVRTQAHADDGNAEANQEVNDQIPSSLPTSESVWDNRLVCPSFVRTWAGVTTTEEIREILYKRLLTTIDAAPIA